MSTHPEFQILPSPPSAPASEVSPKVQEQSLVVSPMAMLQLAVSKGASIDTLTKLMDLADRHEAAQARRAFVEAMTAFKAHSIQVVKDKDNAQYKSKYVSLGNLIATVTPFLSQHGLSVRWEIDQTNSIKVSCVITHVMGHSESVSMVCPPDKSGAKNPIQEIKSAITYAKACTFESICGLASTDANLDDDGNAVSNGELAEQIEWIENSRNLDELKHIFENAFGKAKAAKAKGAMSALIAAKDKRKKELMPEVSA